LNRNFTLHKETLMSTDLINEIRRAREALRFHENKTSEAGFTLRMCKEQEKKARGELDLLLDELETGQSRYTLPGFDRLEVPGSNGATPGAGSSGPNDFVPPTVLPWQDFYFTHDDLDRVVGTACHSLPKNSEDPWPGLLEQGCDDAKILEVLRSIWPSRRPRFEREPDEPMGYTIRGGVEPSIWIGARRSVNQAPTLAGLELAARIRIVLEIPRAAPATVPSSTVSISPAKPARAKARETAP
jgi:hypothetical protein